MRFQSLSLLVINIFVVAACHPKTATPSAASLPTLDETLIRTPTVGSIGPLPTEIQPGPVVTPNLISTITPYVTNTSEARVTESMPTPFRTQEAPTLAALRIRYPSYSSLERFLRSTTIRIFNPDIPEQYEQFTWNDEVPQSFYLKEQTRIDYVDINGDSEEDLILLFADPKWWGLNYVIVMLWQDHQYSQPLALFDGSKLPGSIHYYLEDWTGDDVPELIWQSETANSGTGHIVSTRRLVAIHCLSECNVVWHGTTSVIWNSMSQVVGRGAQVSELSPDPQNGRLTVTSDGFDLPFVIGETSTALIVHDTFREIYMWDGYLFQLEKSEVLQESFEIASIQQLEANHDSWSATIRYEPAIGTGYEFESFLCVLEINSTVIGENIPCNPFFTLVQWLDVTGDDLPEIVIHTLSAEIAVILIWQAREGGFTQIAHLTGSVIHAKLPAIHLEDRDADPALEILTGRWIKETNEFCFTYEESDDMRFETCWWEFMRSYDHHDWNGVEYESVP